ncbi:MAG: hypothetical protein QXI58_07185, partial [Candidatus Micrarchaeia archaeon]
LMGIFAILMNRLIIQWFLFIQKAVALNGDHLTQLGQIKHILNNAHYSSENFYPITHTIISQFLLITDLPINVANYGTGIISAFSIVWIYLLSKILFEDARLQKITLILGLLTFFDRYSLFLMPNGWSIFYLPFILYIYFKYSKEKKPIVLLIFILSILILPYFHPLTAVIFIVTLIIFLFLNIYQNKGTIELYSIFVITIIFISWIMNFKLFESNFKILYRVVFTGETFGTYLSRIENSITKLGLDILGIIRLFFIEMGNKAILILLAIFSFFYFLCNRSSYRNFPEILRLYLISGIIFILYLMHLIGIVKLEALAGERILAYLYCFIILLLPIIFIVNKSKIILLTIFSISVILGIISLYPDPINFKPSAEITYGDLSPASFIFSRGYESSSKFLFILTDPKRYRDFYFGGKLEPFSRDFVGDHFNNINNLATNERYLIINSIDKITYLSVWKNVGRFSEDDFMQLYLKNSTNKIYTNGGNEVWLV